MHQLHSVCQSLTFDASHTCWQSTRWTTATQSCIHCSSICHLALASGTECRCMPQQWCSTHSAHHTLWYIALASRYSAHWIQDCADVFQLCPWYVPCLLSQHVIQLLLSRAVWCWDNPTMQNSLSPAQRENTVVNELSVLLHQLFETICRNTCVLMILVMGCLFWELKTFVCASLLIIGTYENN